MKYLIFVFFLAPAVVYCQDLIVKKTGETIVSKVVEITQNDIRYKRADNPNSPIISILKTEVFVISYENGTRESFENTPGSNGKFQPEGKIGDTQSPEMKKFGHELGEIVLYVGKESGKIRKGEIIGLTPEGAIIATGGKKIVLAYDKISKYVNQPKKKGK